MADQRRRDEWQRVSWLMAWTGRFAGGPFEPDKLNPVLLAERAAGEEPLRLTPEEESEMGFNLMGQALSKYAKPRG